MQELRKGKMKNNNKKERKKNKKGKERKGKKKRETFQDVATQCLPGRPIFWPPSHQTTTKQQHLTNPNYSHFPSVTNLDFLFYAWKNTHTNTGTCTEASRHQFSCPIVDLTITGGNIGFKSITSDLRSAVWSRGWPHTATPGQATNSLNDRPSAQLRSW